METVITENDNVDEDVEEIILWLKHNVEPFNEVLDKWKKTFKYRTKDSNISISEYFHTYKCLNKPSGYLLVSIS